MEENIKSARQSGFILLILLAFTLSLHSIYQTSNEQMQTLWGFWINKALTEQAPKKVTLETDVYPEKQDDILRSVTSIVEHHRDDDGYIQDANVRLHPSYFTQELVRVVVSWDFWEINLYTPIQYFANTRGNDQNSTLIFATSQDVNILVFVHVSGDSLDEFKTVPTDPNQFTEFFKILAENMDSFTIYRDDLISTNIDYKNGFEAAFTRVNYNIDTSNLLEATIEAARKATKEDVTIPLLNVTMKTELAYLAIIALAFINLLYLNSQLRLVNMKLTPEEFHMCLLTSWSLYTKTNLVDQFTRYSSGLLGLSGYLIASITPLWAFYFGWSFSKEAGKLEHHWSALIFVALCLLLVSGITMINILQIFSKSMRYIKP